MERYWYFFYSLLFLCVLIFILIRRPDLRHPTIPALVFGVVAGPVSELLYFRDYWQPSTILGKGHASVEDIIFGLSIFGLAFVTYPFLTHKTIVSTQESVTHFYKRFFTILGIGLVLGVTLLTQLNSILATTLVFLVLWILIVYYRKDLIIPGLVVGSVFAAFAFCVYYLLLRFGPPDYLENTWLLFNQRLGITILGIVPLTELVWFFATGCFLSVFGMFTSGKAYQRGDRPIRRAIHSSKVGTPDNT